MRNSEIDIELVTNNLYSSEEMLIGILKASKLVVPEVWGRFVIEKKDKNRSTMKGLLKIGFRMIWLDVMEEI